MRIRNNIVVQGIGLFIGIVAVIWTLLIVGYHP